MIENNEIDGAMERTICTVSLAWGQPDDIMIINYDDVMGLPPGYGFLHDRENGNFYFVSHDRK